MKRRPKPHVVVAAIALSALVAAPAYARDQTNQRRISHHAHSSPDHPAHHRWAYRHGFRHAGMHVRRYESYEGGVSRGCLTPDTRSLLEQIEARFGHVQIISTCRPGAVIAGTNHASMHRYGRAVDFNAPPGRKAEIVRWLAANNRGGTMTYANMGHIHVDTGSYHFVSLGAGGSGGRHFASRSRHARYASTAFASGGSDVANTDAYGRYSLELSGTQRYARRSHRRGASQYASFSWDPSSWHPGPEPSQYSAVYHSQRRRYARRPSERSWN